MATMTGTANTDTPATPFGGSRWVWMLLLGIVQIIAGAIAIAVPVVGSLAAVAVFGALLIVTAILQLYHAFRVRAWPRSVWYGLGGLLYLIAGILVVAFPLGGAMTLAIIIAISLIAEGSLRVMFGAALRPATGSGWLIAAGIASIAVGVLLLIGWPSTALWGVGLLLGVNLIFTGATNAGLAIASRTQRRLATS
jgi:uncharacterized membrane protein HdeD (DUF308 family)